MDLIALAWYLLGAAAIVTMARRTRAYYFIDKAAGREKMWHIIAAGLMLWTGYGLGLLSILYIGILGDYR